MIAEDEDVLRIADEYVGEVNETRDDGLWRGFWVTEVPRCSKMRA